MIPGAGTIAVEANPVFAQDVVCIPENRGWEAWVDPMFAQDEGLIVGDGKGQDRVDTGSTPMVYVRGGSGQPQGLTLQVGSAFATELDL